MVARTGSESDVQLLARSVAELTRRTRFPIGFGGLAREGDIHVTSIVGARSRSLDGLVVKSMRGLGGRASVEKRPRLAPDYRSARGITHDYDAAVLGEGIATLFAIPVVVAGATRGVIYCGSWAEESMGDAAVRPAFGVADELATELRVRDEVERRLALMPPTTEIPVFAPAAREELRESYVELRSIAASVHDEGLRARIQDLERRLAALSRGDQAAGAANGVRLAPREVDVLASVALGATNAEIATALGLREVTIKSYLASAMSKLDASTRHAAVAKARRAGILP